MRFSSETAAKILRWAIVLLALAAIPASAQLLTTGVGQGGFGGAAVAACGTGVIDLSTGCTQPMLGGL